MVGFIASKDYERKVLLPDSLSLCSQLRDELLHVKIELLDVDFHFVYMGVEMHEVMIMAGVSNLSSYIKILNNRDSFHIPLIFA